jgi:RNA polymerase sigma factor (sigma-70 family)
MMSGCAETIAERAGGLGGTGKWTGRQQFSFVIVYQGAARGLRPGERRLQAPRAGVPAARVEGQWTQGRAVRDDPLVVALVARAAGGDQQAWNELIERYAPLVWSICARNRLGRQEIDDVGQSVWLLLVEKIGSLREPAALPGWLATTTYHECLRVLRAAGRHEHAELPPEERMPGDPSAVMIEDEVLAAERDAALRAAFAELPPRHRALLAMLMRDPPASYQEIHARLNIAVGSIGPMRMRALDQLRKSRHVMAIADIPGERITGITTKDVRGD